MKADAKRIFIVDDDPDIIASLELVLTGQGHQVESTVQAEGAVERARAFSPDLLILDVMFPGNPSQGFELAREVQADETLKAVPVLMLSAVNAHKHLGFSNKDRDSAWLPVAEFVEKPVAPKRLVELVNRLTA